MKRLLAAALLSAASLSATGGTASAGEFGVGVGLNLTFSCGKSGKCCKDGCLPPPCWSGSYPQPIPYGGYQAWNPYQQMAQGCAYNGGPATFDPYAHQNSPYNAFAQQGGYGGYNPYQAQAWMQPGQMQNFAPTQAATAVKPAAETIKTPNAASE